VSPEIKPGFRLLLVGAFSLLLFLAAVFLRLAYINFAGGNFNTGIAFGINFASPLLLILLPTILLALLWLTVRTKNYFWPFFFLIIGGLANFLERIIFGNIFDYINLPIFPTLNLADLAISLGAAWLVISFLYGSKKF